LIRKKKKDERKKITDYKLKEKKIIITSSQIKIYVLYIYFFLIESRHQRIKTSKLEGEKNKMKIIKKNKKKKKRELVKKK
jgi:hypothetical protein